MNIRFSTTFFSALMLFSLSSFASEVVVKMEEKELCKCCVKFGGNLQDSKFHTSGSKEKPGKIKKKDFSASVYKNNKIKEIILDLLKDNLICKKRKEKNAKEILSQKEKLKTLKNEKIKTCEIYIAPNEDPTEKVNLLWDLDPKILSTEENINGLMYHKVTCPGKNKNMLPKIITYLKDFSANPECLIFGPFKMIEEATFHPEYEE